MTLRYALLGVLDARSMTGYELAQFFDQSAGWVWSAPHSNIYPALRKMEEEGLLTSETEIKGERLERTVYSITDSGRSELIEWVTSDPGYSGFRDPVLLRATFFDEVDSTEVVAFLERLIERHQEQIRHWSEHRAALLALDTPLLRERLQKRPREEHHRIGALKANVFAGMIELAETWVTWARRTIDLVTESSRGPS
jgi:DNA-binding PadR family transcriptional regulator